MVTVCTAVAVATGSWQPHCLWHVGAGASDAAGGLTRRLQVGLGKLELQVVLVLVTKFQALAHWHLVVQCHDHDSKLAVPLAVTRTHCQWQITSSISH
jgi:hypothetical protein